MPRYIDHHEKLPPMPPEAFEAGKARIQAGQPDQFGVKAVNLLVAADGQGWCISDPPDPESIRKSHGALGIPMNLKEVVEVSSLV